MGGGFSKQKLIICLIILLVLAGGITYAAFKFNFLGGANTLKTNSIELKLLESNTDIIDLKNIFPMPDEQGIKQTDTFDFAVITNTSSNVNMEYNIKIEKLSADTGYNILNDNQIKVYLTDYNNKVLVSPTKVSDLSNYTLYTKTNKHSSTNKKITNKYKLKVWIDNSVNASNWDENTKLEYKFKIGVNGEATKPVPTATDTLITKVGTSGLETVTHEADSTLQIGATESLTEYRFRGSDTTVTNNYVYFNCSDINNQTSSTCELYRIIGIFPTDDGTGNIENRIKLIKAESYNTTDSWVDWNNPSNNWTNSLIKTMLNTTYYNTINESYQSLIGNAKYYLGGTSSTDIKTNIMYQYERKTSGSDYYYGNNPNSWTGKIALMYASDYGYGASSTCSDSTNLYNYNASTCENNNWLYTTSEWLLPQDPSDYYDVLLVEASCVESYKIADFDNHSVTPVFYLTSDAKFNGTGDGSSSNPYQLKG